MSCRRSKGMRYLFENREEGIRLEIGNIVHEVILSAAGSTTSRRVENKGSNS